MLAASLALGCAGGKPSPPTLAAASETDAAAPPSTAASDGGEVVRRDGGADPAAVHLVIDTEPNHLNPDLDPDRWGFRIAYDAIYEPLVRRGAGEAGVVPALADRITIDDGGKRYLFHLRPGVKFHDGQPLSTVDAQFTFERLRARLTHDPRMKADLAELERVEILSGDIVRITATRPSAYLLGAISEVGILPQHVFGRGDLTYQGANRHPVGTGPFRMRSWERGRRILLERFADYWGAPPPARSLDISIDDDSVRVMARVKRGDLDVVGRVPPSYVPEQVESPLLKEAFDVVRARPSRFVFVLWNTAHAPLGDSAVRRALAMAVDRGRLVTEARHGLGRPLGAPPVDGGQEGRVPRFDPAAAQAALDAAGLPRRGDGPRLANGKPWRLGLLLPSGSHESEEAGKRVVDSLVRLGIGVDPMSGDFAAIGLRLKTGKFDAVLLEWAGRPDDDLAPLFRTTGAQNYGHYSVHVVDALLDALHRPGPIAERRVLREQLAAALADDPPALFLYAPEEVFLYAKRLTPPELLGDFLRLRSIGPR